MATELQEEQLTEAAKETEAQPPKPEQSKQQPPEKPKQKRELLLPFLTLLLIVLGLSEAAFWGCFGVSSYRHSLAVEQYETRQRALEEERAARGITGGSAYGPNLRVENGVVTWQREDWLSAGSSASPESPAPSQPEEKRLSGLYVPQIPYTLAEMDEPQGQRAEPVESGEAPASA